MDNKKITFTIPYFSVSGISRDLLNSYSNLKQKTQNFGILLAKTRTTITDRSHNIVRKSMDTINNGFKKRPKKILPLVIPVILLVIVGLVLFQAFRPDTQSSAATPNTESKDVVIDSQELNKVYDFPLLDGNGEEIGSFSYEVQKAELRNEIIVQGQRASAVEGRVFLIVNLKLKNNLTQGLEINSRDYIRLSANDNKDDLLAPEIHNDPVEVQAISSKFTRLGFAINETDTNLVLIIGEIDGEKQEIELKF